MNIRLKKLTLTNFKGIRSFSVIFNDITNIFGANTSGKTTLKDAFLWLFFGKDSSDRKDFEIKTLDEHNNPYHNLDHEVEAVIDLDGEEIIIRRSMREKWTKKRGSSTAEFTGHETAFFWNDVPMKEGEYQGKVSSVFNENIFKLITNTDYFNGLKWQERRGVLMQIAGVIDNGEILKDLCKKDGPDRYEDLIYALGQKKSVDEFKKEISAKKKKIKDELEMLPARIDEANRSLPEEKDFSAIEKMIVEASADLQTTEAFLSNKSQAAKDHQNKMLTKQKEVGDHRQRLQQIEFEQKNKIQQSKQTRDQAIIGKNNELRAKQNEKDRLLVNYNADVKRKEGLVLVKDDLAKKWESINNESLVFNESDFHCPACRRAFEAGTIDSKKLELTNNFNADKARRLKDVTDRGTKTKEDIAVIDANLENIKQQGTLLASEISLLQGDLQILTQENIRLSADEETSVKEAIATDTEHKGILEMIRLLEEEINTPFPEDDNTELISRKRAIQMNIDEWRKELSGKDQRNKILARITELKEQEANMAQELATLEGVEFSIEQFVKAKMDTLESRINGRFKLVQFKMFEEQINGGRIEACTTLIKGVPYSDANTAAKVQAGLDIINTLSDHYGVYGPVWVDNRESVTWLPETKSQLINLIVSEGHKKLTVEKAASMVMA
jgi:exonuclease SbcC